MISQEQYDNYTNSGIFIFLLLLLMEIIKLTLNDRKMCKSFMFQYVFCCCVFMGVVISASFRNMYANSPPFLFEGLMTMLCWNSTFWNASLFANTVQLIIGNWLDLGMYYLLATFFVVSYYCVGNLLIMNGFI